MIQNNFSDALELMDVTASRAHANCVLVFVNEANKLVALDAPITQTVRGN
ncbi:MAG: hypothetical protein IAF58_15440 [Leptolyngbya sp.]|nr:hypothetical protein [Candidatus Melainabacteria bacterium]